MAASGWGEPAAQPAPGSQGVGVGGAQAPPRRLSGGGAKASWGRVPDDRSVAYKPPAARFAAARLGGGGGAGLGAAAIVRAAARASRGSTAAATPAAVLFLPSPLLLPPGMRAVKALALASRAVAAAVKAGVLAAWNCK